MIALEAWHQIQIRTVPSRQWPQMAPFRPDPAPSSRPNGPYECLTCLTPDPASSPLPPQSSGRANASLTPGPEAGLACARLPTQALQGSVLHQPGSPLLNPLSPFSAQLKCPPLPHRALVKPPCPRPLSWSPPHCTHRLAGRALEGSLQPCCLEEWGPALNGGLKRIHLGWNPASTTRTGVTLGSLCNQSFSFPIYKMGK